MSGDRAREEIVGGRRVVVDGEIVTVDGQCVGWVIRRRVGLRRRWFGVALYKPHQHTGPHPERMAAACDLAHLNAGGSRG